MVSDVSSTPTRSREETTILIMRDVLSRCDSSAVAQQTQVTGHFLVHYERNGGGRYDAHQVWVETFVESQEALMPERERKRRPEKLGREERRLRQHDSSITIERDFILPKGIVRTR